MTKLCDFKRDTPQDFGIDFDIVIKYLLSKETRTRNKWYNLKYYCQQSITNAAFNVTLSVQSVHH